MLLMAYLLLQFMILYDWRQPQQHAWPETGWRTVFASLWVYRQVLGRLDATWDHCSRKTGLSAYLLALLVVMKCKLCKTRPMPAAFNYSNPLWIDIFGNIESLIHETNSSDHLQKSYRNFFMHQLNMAGVFKWTLTYQEENGKYLHWVEVIPGNFFSGKFP